VEREEGLIVETPPMIALSSLEEAEMLEAEEDPLRL